MQEAHISSESSLYQQIAQLDSENLILQTELGTLKDNFKQLSSIHSKCRSQKEKISVGVQTLTKNEVTFCITVYISMEICMHDEKVVAKYIGYLCP